MTFIHHQFESIHPFCDGNGRTGRIINVLYLVKEKILDIPLLYLSRVIVRTNSDYYTKLQAVRTQYLYYTSTSQQLMMRVAVDPRTSDPADKPEFVAGGRYWDYFVLDEDAGIAYVTTHRENTIDRVAMQADGNREGFVVAAGNPFTDALVGPSSGVWGRGSRDYGRVAYFTTDGEPRSRWTEFFAPPRCCE